MAKKPARTKDVRGFTTFDEFECTYGTRIRVKESSAASDPHVWLFLDQNPAILTKPEPGNAAAHLNLKQVDRLIEALTAIKRDHYQLR